MITIIAAITAESGYYAIFGIVELAFIFSVTELIAVKSVRTANIINALFLFIFNIETIVLCLSGERIRLIMMENVGSFMDLAGDMVLYGICVLLLIICTFLPLKKISSISEKTDTRILAVALLTECCLALSLGNAYSALYSPVSLVEEYVNRQEFLISVEDQPDMTKKFYKAEVDSYTDIIAMNTEKPNVVLVLAEGLSQSIIEDERSIMPNVRAFQERSINFLNYYNHTAATYRGIIGQLYSGHQINNLDTNSLISIQAILKDYGYNTAFINTEPKNKEYTKYLESMNFDNVISDNQLEGPIKSISDKHAFELLLESMKTMSETTDGDARPFFLTMYTFGTHNTFDSVDEKFGDGTDRVLNKFYNLDNQFGKFLKAFNESEFSDSTIIIFTADHCAYNAVDFREAFPSYERTAMFLDRIPFSIYWKGVTPEIVDATGRNSLDMAPTVLDIMGISAPNYFLGESLYNPHFWADSIDNIYYDGDVLTSAGGAINPLDGQRAATFDDILNKYYIATQQGPQTP